MSSTLAKHQLSKVFIGCDQQGSFLHGQPENVVVRDSWAHLRHVRDLMAMGTERLDDLTLYSLVAQEPQAGPLGTG